MMDGVEDRTDQCDSSDTPTSTTEAQSVQPGSIIDMTDNDVECSTRLMCRINVV